MLNVASKQRDKTHQDQKLKLLCFKLKMAALDDIKTKNIFIKKNDTMRKEGNDTKRNGTKETKRPDAVRQDAKRNGRERKKQDETKRNDAKKI